MAAPTGKQATPPIMHWRQWIQPLEAARAAGDPPLAEDRLAALVALAREEAAGGVALAAALEVDLRRAFGLLHSRKRTSVESAFARTML
ncbi:MAG: hypothetical protein VXW25_07215, partial [Pseudomonadota bacterium]|nr:hypothetical protein [Pseudomonadota bacterium]